VPPPLSTSQSICAPTAPAQNILSAVLPALTTGWLVAFVVELHVARGRPMDLPVLLGVPTLLSGDASCAAGLPVWLLPETNLKK
jgi:hypothetical protein